MKKLKNLILFVGPSGVGKGEIFKGLLALKKLSNLLKFSCSVTTRKPRKGEIDGKHYHFISKERFESLIKDDQLVEYNLHFNNYYGTLVSELETIAYQEKVPFVEVETAGANQIISYFKERGQKEIVTSFFIAPPSIETLGERLKKRDADDEEGIRMRLIKAKEELLLSKNYDHVIVNQDVEVAVREIADILEKRLNIN